MEISVEEAIKDLEEDISEKKNQIELIKSIDWSRPVNEKTWHEICETPLRSSDLLSVLLKNIFPDAEEINVHCNYVYFKLHGFKCGLPTSRCNGTYIDTGWYEKDNGKPTSYGTIHQYKMTKYFEAKDNKENWEILFNHRISHCDYYKKWVKFLLWFGYYKWKDDKREEWEKVIKENQENLEKSIDRYNQKRKEMYERTKTMVEVVIPELKKFSMKVYKLYEHNWRTPEEIAKFEGFDLEI